LTTGKDQDAVTRDQPFGYRCNGCGHCCHHFLVRVNAYEIGRLAGALDFSPEAFNERYTVVRGGLRVLRQDSGDGRCVFRSEQGCAVYADRPLACRLYPLVRTEGPDGAERWRIPEPDPASRGDRSGPGVVGDYLSAQGVEPYLGTAGA
jgi:uncharacterized protein